MKNKKMCIACTILIITSMGFLSAQNTAYSEYPMDLVHRFSSGRSTGELRLYDAPSMSGYPGPTSLTFLEDHRILIVDVWNERLSIYNQDFEIQEEINTTNGRPLAGPFHYFAHEDAIVGTSMPDSWAGIHLDGDVFFRMGKRDSPLPENRYRSYWYHNGVLFIHDKDNNLVSITDPSPISEENQFSFRNTEQTRALFEPDSDWDPQGLSVDDQDRLFLDGELVTLDYQSFYEYWEEIHGGEVEKLTDIGMRISTRATMRYMGTDLDGNHYWAHYHIGVAIFSSEGTLFHRIRYDDNLVSTMPAVSPEGDIYLMGYEDDSINIYRIDRRW